jgi:hypothetical protein
MASKKITALTAYATPLDTDVLPIVDLVGNETKKIKVGDLLTAVSVMPKVYKAYISQYGVADPTVVEIINTIGAIVWTRSAGGTYIGTLAGAFPAATTFFMLGGNTQGLGTTSKAYIQRASDNILEIYTYDSGALDDDVMQDTSIIIEVYP